MSFANKGYPVMSQGNMAVNVDSLNRPATVTTDAGDFGLMTTPTQYKLITTALTATRALSADDNGRRLVNSGASNYTLTIPSGLDSSFTCEVIQMSTGTVTLAAGSGTTLAELASHFATGAAKSFATLRAVAADTYLLTGATLA